MGSFKGKYEAISAEKHVKFLKELGGNFLLRKAATASTPVMKVSEDGGVWTIKTITTPKTIKLKFNTPDGREVTAIVTLEGNKLISVKKAKKEIVANTKSTHEFNEDEVIFTMTIDGKADRVCM